MTENRLPRRKLLGPAFVRKPRSGMTSKMVLANLSAIFLHRFRSPGWRVVPLASWGRGVRSVNIFVRVGAVLGSFVMLIASIGIAVAGPASASTVEITVTSSADGVGTCPSASDCTLRQAVADANTGGPNDASDPTITIAPGLGPITLETSLDYDGGASGGQALTLLGNGATIAGDGSFALLVDYTTDALVIDGVVFTGGGGGTGGAVTMPDGSSSLRVTNSIFTGNTTTTLGGAVMAVGSAEFEDVVFSANSSGSGGAVYVTGNASFTDVAFVENDASNVAGAVYQSTDSLYTRTTFTSNTAAYAGGAILGSGTASISGSIFNGNSGALVGGGAVAITGDLNLIDSEFHENITGGDAGAVYVGGGSSIQRSRFMGNTASGIAGAILATEASTVSDSTFRANSSNNDGGALTVYGSLSLSGSTLAENSSTVGEGAFWADGVATIVNSTLVGNVGGAVASTISAEDLVLAYSTITEINVADGQTALVARSNRLSAFASVIAGAEGLSGGLLCNAAATSFGHNIATDSTCGLTGTGDTQEATLDSLKLGLLLDNGGPAPTQLPHIDSPLVGAIPNADCATGPAATVVTDQRGFARPNVVGGPCDIGAVQLTPAVAATVAGSTVTVEVREFTSTVTITVYSDPVVLGVIPVDETGFGTATFEFPPSVVCGSHQIIATAIGGQVASTPIELSGCVVPSFTG